MSKLKKSLIPRYNLKDNEKCLSPRHEDNKKSLIPRYQGNKKVS